MADKKIDDFLSRYNEEVTANALQLRKIILASLPGISEQLDISAKMIAYCYGQKYADLICVIIPSKNGLKLGFNRGTELPDPGQLLEGKGKVSRYVEISSNKILKSRSLQKMIIEALKLYRQKFISAQ